MGQKYPEAKIPLILRFHRLMDAFAKSDDERDFYMDKVEGFLVYADLDKDEADLKSLESELQNNRERYYLIPKMTFFEIKKFMEGFVQEKVYDIDTKEKLLDIIGSSEPRENFLEFIYDHLNELEKWQIYYQERSRIKIIEWLRSLNVKFVFEEDLELGRSLVEKLKRTIFEDRVSKDISAARQILFAKVKTYYSSEALNPRPKRGRPPKQSAKVEVEPQFTSDLYSTVPPVLVFFLYVPDIASASSVTFSAKFETEEQLLASLRGTTRIKVDEKLEALSQRLESLQQLSQRLGTTDLGKAAGLVHKPKIIRKAEVVADREESKIGHAAHEAIPQRPGEGGKKGGFATQKKKSFAIKSVAKIKSPKKKK